MGCFRVKRLVGYGLCSGYEAFSNYGAHLGCRRVRVMEQCRLLWVVSGIYSVLGL